MESSKFRYDLKALAEDLGFEIEDIRGIFLQYFEEMQGCIEDMNTYLSSRDWYMLERVIHNIKGVSVNLNIMDVYKACADFDSQLKANNTKDAEHHVKELIELINDSNAELKRILKYSMIMLI